MERTVSEVLDPPVTDPPSVYHLVYHDGERVAKCGKRLGPNTHYNEITTRSLCPACEIVSRLEKEK